MVKLKHLTLALGSIAAIAAGGWGVASAATPGRSSTTIGTSGISRSVFRQDRLEAEAEVLNKSTADIQTAHKDKTMKQLLASANLTPSAFHQKVKAQLTSKLEAQGYSQDQITIALQRKEIHRLRHHEK